MAADVVSPSAIRLEWPRTFSGSAALSVETFTKCSTPTDVAASSTLSVPEDVGLDRLSGVILEDVHVLQRGCVKHDLWAASLEDLVHPLGVPDVGEDDIGRLEVGPATYRQQQRVEGGFVPIEHHELGGRERADLAAQLGPDRASGARDENTLARRNPAMD